MISLLKYTLYFVALGFVSAYPERLDLLIIFDTSSSISRESFRTSLNFVAESLYYRSISPGTTRIGIVTFASKPRLEFSFEKFVNREGVVDYLRYLEDKPLKRKTNIGSALKTALKVFKTYKGLAKRKEIHVFSDGKWNSGEDPGKTIDHLTKLGVKIIVFAIGRRPRISNLLNLASQPSEIYTFRLNNNDKPLLEMIQDVTGRAESFVRCTGKGKVRDECNRECSCIDGYLTNCFRVRREFTAMSFADRKTYLKAYFKLTTEEPLKSRFAKFISKHQALFFKGIHDKPQFFPWHRWYVYEFENLMKEINCTITVPFWDWSYWSDVVWEMDKHIWRDDQYGLGGNGNATKDFCVQTGPFKENTWKAPATTSLSAVLGSVYEIMSICKNPNMSEHHKFCLRRSFNKKPVNVSNVIKTINIPCSNFNLFEQFVRDYYHNDMHNFIGGDMCSDYAANSPEFFFHHGFLDNIWYRWQNLHPECKFDYYLKNDFHLLGCKFKSHRFVDSHDQGEQVKVKYEDFLSGRVDPKILASKSYHTKKRAEKPTKSRHKCKSGTQVSDAPFERLKRSSALSTRYL